MRKNKQKHIFLLLTFLFSDLTHSQETPSASEAGTEKSPLAKVETLTKQQEIIKSQEKTSELTPLIQEPQTIKPEPNDASEEFGKEIHKELIEIHDQLQKLKPWYTALFPGIFTIIGIVTGGIISLLIQRGQRAHDTAERLKKSGFEAKLKLIEYRSKQVNEFYGPMLVLLKQSKELSTHLHTQLAKDDPERYRFKSDKTSKNGKALFIHEPGRSGKPRKAFRLISELPYLGEHHKTALPRVQVIIDTGERLAKLIEEKSGLVKPNSQELIGCLGVYLAHLAALRDAYSLTQNLDNVTQRTHDAVFPREIETLTRSDYDEFIQQIDDWENSINKIIKD